jgi:hypothetical protein
LYNHKCFSEFLFFIVHWTLVHFDWKWVDYLKIVSNQRWGEFGRRTNLIYCSKHESLSSFWSDRVLVISKCLLLVRVSQSEGTQVFFSGCNMRPDWVNIKGEETLNIFDSEGQRRQKIYSRCNLVFVDVHVNYSYSSWCQNCLFNSIDWLAYRHFGTAV